MESNEISMFMDVKLDINDKRPAAAKFKIWTRCEVKIEAIKCLPCFLRISIIACCDGGIYNQDVEQHQQSLSISVNVPGVTISLATSRTKEYSYGVFWTQNRRDCYVYFALDTEASCRQHMKWLKKSIKNLELYRKVFLEERRNSRAPAAAVQVNAQQGVAANVLNGAEHKFSLVKLTSGPVTKFPNHLFDVSNTSWSRRISRASDIYEEIFEGTQNGVYNGNDPPRLSRRFSRSSIASGIYEEMQPTAASNFNAIVEEMALEMTTPPPLPPLPPPRKRINTFHTEGMLGEIPRSSTNPESALAKKTKYRNMLDNIFAGVNGGSGGTRSKRAESFNESQTCTAEELTKITPKPKPIDVIYVNEGIAAKRQKQPSKTPAMTLSSKRNSFSSPDLSKINFLDSFNEYKLSDLLQNSFTTCEDLILSDDSLADSMPSTKPTEKWLAPIWATKSRADSLESFNISQKIPNNFNFSACNSSSVNLVGCNGAALLQSTSSCMQKNNILIDDMTGYCIMAPIKKKTNADHIKSSCLIQPQIHKHEPTSSGYSTCSYCSTLSSCTNSTEDHICQVPLSYHRHRNLPIVDDSVIYEQMLASSNNSATATAVANASNIAADFTGNLYENLLTVKATQELESQSPLTIPPKTNTTANVVLATSTPTESPQTHLVLSDNNIVIVTEEENYYQTPRKSIISVDEKIPSYYPNSCDTAKQRRHSQSPAKVTTPLATALPAPTSEKSSATVALRQLVNVNMRRNRKENLYISSPQKIHEQRHNAASSASSSAASKCSKSTHKSKKTAHKISENVYAVTHLQKKSTNNNKGTTPITSKTTVAPTGFSDEMKEKLHTELLQLAMLQKIDFKFDDAGAQVIEATPASFSANEIKQHSENADVEYENCFQATKNASRLLQKYATTLNVATQQQKLQLQMTNSLTPQRAHYLQVNQTSNTPASAANSRTPSSAMTQSKLETHISATANSDVQLSAIKKFASLPRFKKIDFSPLKLKINNVLQRNHQQEF